ncbi:MAG: hypothetical protein ACT4PX_09870 [Actinomycetota bacterium]
MAWRRLAAGALVAFGLAWVARPGGTVDGPILLILTADHGIHLGDLISPASVLAGVVVLVWGGR